MKNRVTALILVLLLLSATPAWSEETRTFVPTDQWTPPEIVAEEVLDTQPWLLVLKIAQEEVGYVEGPRNDESKYGAWFAGANVPWCAEFLSWCANEADVRYGTHLYQQVFPKYGKPKEGAPWFLQRERFITSTRVVPVTLEQQWLIGADHYLENNEYIPYPGDYLWISYFYPRVSTDHVAIVEGVSIEPDGEYAVHVIEGNNPDRVQRAVYLLSYSKIYGYGTPVRRANRVIRLYDGHDDIQPLQEFLIEKGFMSSKSFNARELSETAVKALKAYQKSVGISATGKVDLATRTQMESDPVFQQAMEKYPAR